MSSKQLSGILNRAIAPTPKVAPQPEPEIVQAPEIQLSADILTLPKVETPTKAARAKPEPIAEPQRPIQAYVPASLVKALNMRAAEEGTTVRTLILQGLKGLGLPVPEAELRDKRK
jgi:hypothetical protein